MSRKGVLRRLEELEERTFGADPFSDFPDWGLDDQLEWAAEVLFERGGPATAAGPASGGARRSRYPATDREIFCFALLCAERELPGGVGEHAFPSGLVVAWGEIDEDGTREVSASAAPRLEDLPEEVRRSFERMDPAKQPERERFLYSHRHYLKKARECRAWCDEHGWDKTPPEHLRYWADGGSRGEGGG